MDTGPACCLTLRNHLETPALSATAGAMSEDYVISEIVKSQVNQDMMCDAVSAIAEILINLMILQNGTVYPIEMTAPSFQNSPLTASPAHAAAGTPSD